MGNRSHIEAVVDIVREKFGDSKTIWLYTGYMWDMVKDLPIMQKIDVVVDGPFILEQKDLSMKWKGSANQRVIDVKATLASDTPEVPILHCNDYEEFTESEMQLFDAKVASCCG